MVMRPHPIVIFPEGPELTLWKDFRRSLTSRSVGPSVYRIMKSGARLLRVLIENLVEGKLFSSAALIVFELIMIDFLVSCGCFLVSIISPIPIQWVKLTH